MRKQILITLTVVLLLASDGAAESTLFGPSKNDLAYQKMTVKNRDNIAILNQRIYTLKERVDGLTTVIEGLNATINDLQQRGPSSASGDLSLLEAKIERISRECVKQKDLNSPGNASGTKGRSTAQSAKMNSDTDNSLAGQSNSVLYSEGVRFFQKNKYSEAKKRFMITQGKGYKPAASNYYLGEIAYYTKKYSDAIFYFKKSAGLYDQASYIDTLLLHTAISLEKTGDKTQAKAFYQTIIEGYSEKKSAAIARKKLKNL